MASSRGHLHQLVAKNIKLFRTAWRKSTAQLLQSLRPARSETQPIYVRNNHRHTLHPVALLRQSQRRSYTTRALEAVRKYYTTPSLSRVASRYDRSKLPSSRTASAIAGFTGRAPFATTLRPNLTGGTLGRTAGGYTLGAGRTGGARYFSHGPAPPAEVIQNVSQAVRAFCLSGHQARYGGFTSRGEKRYNAIGILQHDTARKTMSLPKVTPGSFVEFVVNPTITALTPLDTVAGYRTCPASVQTLQSHGLLDVLTADFSRALKDLAAILDDLNCLSELGDLPITYCDSTSLRVHFPGCDAHTVETLCGELGVKRGNVVQDEDFDGYTGTDIALLYPFAPDEVIPARDGHSVACDEHAVFFTPVREDAYWQHMLSSQSDIQSSRSSNGSLADAFSTMSLLSPASLGFPEDFGSNLDEAGHSVIAGTHDPLEYQDFEGIYRFIELCDSARR